MRSLQPADETTPVAILRFGHTEPDIVCARQCLNVPTTLADDTTSHARSKGTCFKCWGLPNDQRNNSFQCCIVECGGRQPPDFHKAACSVQLEPPAQLRS